MKNSKVTYSGIVISPLAVYVAVFSAIAYSTIAYSTTCIWIVSPSGIALSKKPQFDIVRRRISFSRIAKANQLHFSHSKNPHNEWGSYLSSLQIVSRSKGTRCRALGIRSGCPLSRPSVWRDGCRLLWLTGQCRQKRGASDCYQCHLRGRREMSHRGASCKRSGVPLEALHGQVMPCAALGMGCMAIANRDMCYIVECLTWITSISKIAAQTGAFYIYIYATLKIYLSSICFLSLRSQKISSKVIWNALERDTGIEPASLAWEASVLPLY